MFLSVATLADWDLLHQSFYKLDVYPGRIRERDIRWMWGYALNAFQILLGSGGILISSYEIPEIPTNWTEIPTSMHWYINIFAYPGLKLFISLFIYSISFLYVSIHSPIIWCHLAMQLHGHWRIAQLLRFRSFRSSWAIIRSVESVVEVGCCKYFGEQRAVCCIFTPNFRGSRSSQPCFPFNWGTLPFILRNDSFEYYGMIFLRPETFPVHLNHITEMSSLDYRIPYHRSLFKNQLHSVTKHMQPSVGFKELVEN